MPSNVGQQTVTVKFFEQADSAIVNRIGKAVRKTGIYSGGYLTKLSDTSVSLATLLCEIGDGTTQISVATALAVTITVGPSTPFVVLRWAYTGSASADYMNFVAVASGNIQTNDLIVGLCTFTGSTLTGFDYSDRTTPLVFDLFLKVEPTNSASMQLRVRAGQINYGVVNFDVADQLTGTFSAPGSNSRIDLVYIDTNGAVTVATGTIAASPVAPAYAGKAVLAEVTLNSGQTSITETSIKDVRASISAIGAAYNNLVLLTGDQTVAGVKTFSSFPVTPNANPSTNLQAANKQYVDSKTGFGDPSTRSSGAIYQAATDGVVTCLLTTNHITQAGYAIGYTDSNASPSQIMGQCSVCQNGQTDHESRFDSFTMFIKKGNYYKVVVSEETIAGSTGNGAPDGVIYFTPVGA